MPVNLPDAQPHRTWAIRRENFHTEIAAIVWDSHNPALDIYVEFYDEEGIVVAVEQVEPAMRAYWRSVALGLANYESSYFCEPGDKVTWHPLAGRVTKRLDLLAAKALAKKMEERNDG